MSYSEKRKQVDLLQQKINAHGELSAEVKKKSIINSDLIGTTTPTVWKETPLPWMKHGV